MKKIEIDFRKKRSLVKFVVKMKLLSFLLCFSMASVASNLYSQEVRFTFELKRATLGEVFNEIESNSQYIFIYSEKTIDLDKRVNVSAQDNDIYIILDQVLDNNVSYEIYDRQVIIKSKQEVKNVSVKSLVAEPQENGKEVKGKIVDSRGMPIPGATVVVQGTTNGVVTDVDGNFRINRVPENGTLVISFVGMETQRISVVSKKELKIKMSDSAVGLNEVVVVGYGSQAKSDLTGAIASVSADDFENVPTVNVAQSLQGKIAGLNIVNSSGSPGATPTITIRGVNSLTASNSPLLIVDGIPFSGNLSDINPNDIESMSVLKDASSSAIYGSRGANGVIIITTKAGKKGQAALTATYHGSIGVQSIARKLDLLSPSQYIMFREDYEAAQGGVDFSPENLLNSYEYDSYLSGETVDWQDEVYRMGIYQDHQFSVSGATDKTQYYTSLGASLQDGVVENTQFKRYTLRMNVSHDVTDWFSFGVNSQYTFKDNSGATPSLTSTVRLSPYGKMYEEDGSIAFYPEYPEIYYPNPFSNISQTNDRTTERIDMKGFAELKLPLEGLKYRLNYGITSEKGFQGQYFPKESLTGSINKGQAYIWNQTAYNSTLENIVTYDKEFNDIHKLNITGLYSWQETIRKSSDMLGKEFTSDAGLYYTMSSAETLTANSSLTETFLESYMGRVNYSLMEKYSVTATIRTDGYSAFGANNKYATFPSLGLSWNVNKENFLRNSKIVDMLKLRLSWGKNGNQAINPYQTIDSYRLKSYVTGEPGEKEVGCEIHTVGNPSLKWETTTSTNLGVDFGFIGRITGAIDFYTTQTNDLLMTRTVPVMNGYQSILENVGKTKNKGIEIALNGLCVETVDFSWNMGLTFSANRDEIVALRGDGVDDLSKGWFIGKPLQVNWGYNPIGVYKTQEQVDKSAQPGASLGDAILEDVNGDGTITPDDRKVISSRNPDFRYGIKADFRYKNLALNVFLNGVAGMTQTNHWLNPGVWQPDKNTNYLDMPYWSVTRPDGDYVSPAYNKPVDHAFYQDASFLRIQDVTLSYNLGDFLLEKLKIKDWQLYVSGRNLYVWTDWIGYDPESGSSDAYPMPRTFVLGTKITF
ncbi:MAG: SusC/RagA family TonB-linked outer membrane protein [Bacteroidales bacterium]